MATARKAVVRSIFQGALYHYTLRVENRLLFFFLKWIMRGQALFSVISRPFLVWFGVVGLLGGARQFLVRETPARLRFRNHRNKGLISVDRRTNLLSYLQYATFGNLQSSMCPRAVKQWLLRQYFLNRFHGLDM